MGQEHRRAELLAELDQIRGYCAARGLAGGAGGAGAGRAEEEAGHKEKEGAKKDKKKGKAGAPGGAPAGAAGGGGGGAGALSDYLRRVVSLSLTKKGSNDGFTSKGSNDGPAEGRKGVVRAVVRALREGYGLDAVLLNEAGWADADAEAGAGAGAGKEAAEGGARQTALAKALGAFTARVSAQVGVCCCVSVTVLVTAQTSVTAQVLVTACGRQQVSDDGRLDFSALFGDARPVKLEVCSGAGEWAVAQARADAGRANWVTLELRHDRVHATFTRMAFAGARNLAAVHADAAAALPRLFPAGAFAAILINHPEPPQQTGGEDSQAPPLPGPAASTAPARECARVPAPPRSALGCPGVLFLCALRGLADSGGSVRLG